MPSEELKSVVEDLYRLVKLSPDYGTHQEPTRELKSIADEGYIEFDGSDGTLLKPTQKLLRIYALSQVVRGVGIQKTCSESPEDAFANLTYFVQNGFKFSDSFFNDPCIAKAYAENLQRLENGSKK